MGTGIAVCPRYVFVHKPGFRSGLRTESHALVDVLGNPVALSLSAAQHADDDQAEPLPEDVRPDVPLADKAFDADALVEALLARGNVHGIRPKVNRKLPRTTDFALYRECNLVE